MRAMRFSAGVHSSGLGVGGPIEPASKTPTLSETVPIDSLVNYMQHSIGRHRALWALVVHLIFLGVLITVTELRGTSFVIKETNRYVSEELLLRAQADSVASVDDFFTYLSDVLQRCFKASLHYSPTFSTDGDVENTTSAIYTMNMANVRLMRVDTSMNSGDADAGDDGGEMPRQYFSDQISFLPNFLMPWNFSSEGRARVENEYRWIFHDRDLDFADIPNKLNGTDPFRSDDSILMDPIVNNASRLSHAYVSSPPLQTRLRLLPTTRKQYHIYSFSYADIAGRGGLSYIANTVEYYKNGGFYTVGTSVISAEVIAYEPTDGYFFYGITYVFSPREGSIEMNTYSVPFVIYSLRNHLDHADVSELGFPISLACLDCLLVCFGVYCLGSAIIRIYRGFETSSILGGVGFWELLDMCVFLLVLVTVGFHFYLFYLGTFEFQTTVLHPVTTGISPTEDSRAMSFLFKYGYFHRRVEVMRGWLVLFAMFRTLYLLQYISRLSVVAGTIRSASHEFLSVFLFLMVVTFGFGAGGMMIFGSNVTGFRNIFDAFTFLIQLLASGEVHNLAELEAADVTAFVYLLIYFLASYFILLNVLIGILASGFTTTVESYDLVRRANWSPVFLFRDLNVVAREILGIGKFTSDETKVSSRSSFAARIKSYHRLQRCLRTLQMSQNDYHSHVQDANVTLKQLVSISSSFMTDEFILLLFRKAQQQIGTSCGKTRHVRLHRRRLQMAEKLMSDIEELHRKCCEVHRMLVGDDGAGRIITSEPASSQIRSQSPRDATRSASSINEATLPVVGTNRSSKLGVHGGEDHDDVQTDNDQIGDRKGNDEEDVQKLYKINNSFWECLDEEEDLFRVEHQDDHSYEDGMGPKSAWDDEREMASILERMSTGLTAEINEASEDLLDIRAAYENMLINPSSS